MFPWLVARATLHRPNRGVTTNSEWRTRANPGWAVVGADLIWLDYAEGWRQHKTHSNWFEPPPQKWYVAWWREALVFAARPVSRVCSGEC